MDQGVVCQDCSLLSSRPHVRQLSGLQRQEGKELAEEGDCSKSSIVFEIDADQESSNI